MWQSRRSQTLCRLKNNAPTRQREAVVVSSKVFVLVSQLSSQRSQLSHEAVAHD